MNQEKKKKLNEAAVSEGVEAKTEVGESKDDIVPQTTEDTEIKSEDESGSDSSIDEDDDFFVDLDEGQGEGQTEGQVEGQGEGQGEQNMGHGEGQWQRQTIEGDTTVDLMSDSTFREEDVSWYTAGSSTLYASALGQSDTSVPSGGGDAE